MTQSKRREGARWRVAAQLVVILAALLLLQWWRALPLASGEAPALAGELVGGGWIDLRAQRDRPALVYFWATWCPVCRLGNGDVDALAEGHRVITVAMQSGGTEEVRAYLAEKGLGFPVLSDPDGALANRWGVEVVPTSFIVDAQGRIRFATVGYTTAAGHSARLWAAGLAD